ncbi:MAG: FAD-dependent oxidoreductase, partial [Actinobacteria bacterium]|nr:FAD-dependent oxidoreductase [Actinomycetota bacterium]
MIGGHRYDVAVVGCGMLGSSAARRLADAGCDVVLIGQSEPTDHRTHTGVFASHPDIARV